MTFKEQVLEDFANVLLDPEVYGRICSWNGAALKIAEDANVESQDYEAQGVNADKKIIYCRNIDLVPAPSVTEEVNLDGKRWYVEDVKTPFGFFVITLRRMVI